MHGNQRKTNQEWMEDSRVITPPKNNKVKILFIKGNAIKK